VTTTDLLLDAVRTATGRPALAYAAPPAPLSGGFWAEMYAVRFTGAPAGLDGDLVARISPEPWVAQRDAAVQGAVADLGFPTAPIRLALGEACAVGRAVTLMDRLPGRPLLDLDGLSPLDVVRVAPRLPRFLGSLAAALHSLDPRPVRAAMAPFGQPSIPELLERNVNDAEHVGRPDLARAASVLARLTEPDPQVPCHGDLHALNVLVDGERAFLIDWTVSRMAHPAFDLAFTRLTLTDPPMSVPSAVRPVIKATGAAMAARVVRRYRRLAGHGITVTSAELARYRAVHSHRILLEIARWEANGEEHPGHPWFSLAPLAARSIEEVTTVRVAVSGRAR